MSEFNLYGIFVPALLVYAILAAVLTTVVKRILIAIGFYRLVWHASLFDVALFTILVGVVFLAFNAGSGTAIPVFRLL